ncbi:MAG: hypothetical protein IH614_07380, partial [Desulfuromonadales bacterium]|nr:hypothetical protein [Desulfuromonadales bacterium]
MMRSAVFLFGLLSAGALFCSSAVSAQEVPPIPQMSVSGQALLQVPADQMRLSVGVVTQAPSVEAAMRENT